MAYNSMGLHPNHMIKGLSCIQEARLQIISLLLSMVLTYTCAIFKTTKGHKTLHQFCGSLYFDDLSISLVDNNFYTTWNNHPLKSETPRGPWTLLDLN